MWLRFVTTSCVQSLSASDLYSASLPSRWNYYGRFDLFCLCGLAFVQDFLIKWKKKTVASPKANFILCGEKNNTAAYLFLLWFSESSCRANESGKHERSPTSLLQAVSGLVISAATVYCSTKNAFEIYSHIVEKNPTQRYLVYYGNHVLCTHLFY